MRATVVRLVGGLRMDMDGDGTAKKSHSMINNTEFDAVHKWSKHKINI